MSPAGADAELVVSLPYANSPTRSDDDTLVASLGIKKMI